MRTEILALAEDQWSLFIVLAREELRLTQAQFADEFGLALSTVVAYEHGLVQRPHPRNYRRLTQEISLALQDCQA